MNDLFPNSLAVNIASQVKLHSRKRVLHLRLHEIDRVLNDKEIDLFILLGEFQTAAIALSFKECLPIYYGHKLSKKQRKALKQIHASTKIWFGGYLLTKSIDDIDLNTRGAVNSIKTASWMFDRVVNKR